MGDLCFKCGTERLDAPGIGTFCPNRDCDAGECTTQECIDKAKQALAAMTERFRLKRELAALAETMSPERLRALIETATTPARSEERRAGE
jgi:hypothetical protein